MTRLGWVLVLYPTLAFAQSQQPYVAPDQQLWETMERELHKISMPEDAHLAVRNVMQAVQREAQMREARAKATSKPEEKQ